METENTFQNSIFNDIFVIKPTQPAAMFDKQIFFLWNPAAMFDNFFLFFGCETQPSWKLGLS